MKRSDLEVGKEYYYAKSNSRWEDNLYEGSKVIVVDTDCWEAPISRWGYRTAATPFKVTKGLGVLVDMVEKDYNSEEENATKLVRRVVSITAIRGLYEETIKAVKEQEDARKQRERAASDKRDQNNDLSDRATELAKDNGITVRHGGYGSNDMIIKTEDLIRLLERK